MFSFGFICLDQREPSDFAPEDVSCQISVERSVTSGRGGSSQFWPLFQLLTGCTYELGHWHNPHYFSAWDMLHQDDRDGPGHRTRVRVRREYRHDVDYVLGTLVGKSPKQSVLVFLDKQGIPETFRVIGPMTRAEFWKHHDAKGLISGWLYSVVGEPKPLRWD